MENKFKKLLDEALRIKTNFNRTKNYFQVSGYPHYENVVSNILAFYLDAQEEHGLSNLWLESLMNCYKNANADNSDLPADSLGRITKTVLVIDEAQDMDIHEFNLVKG